ncbi:trimeric intracellular cation channel family protein [Haloplanus pelagicus]|uniref:trimeric intracellular cation channel family protein n=1 Tax=Haloplanus pelagicus TaxID=2949995 RepID=UPI00203EB332|nr:TRIC cation channel family protein [Haloplanus sp. HW8-1]
MTQNLVSVLFGDSFAVTNATGLVAFALVGSAKAIREEFDLFGITVVGLATAFAGGVTRDLLVNRVPLALQSPAKLGLGLLGVGVAVVLSVVLRAPDEHSVAVVADAVGLAAFATAGAIVATEAGVSAPGIVAVAAINAVGGGAFADVLLDRSPFILFDDFYSISKRKPPFRGGMKPTAGETLIMSALVGCGAESEVRIRTLRGGR